MIVAGLQVNLMARNEKGMGYSEKSRSLRGSHVSWGFKGVERRAANRLAVPKQARKLCVKKNAIRGAEFCTNSGAKFARKIWAYDLQP